MEMFNDSHEMTGSVPVSMMTCTGYILPYLCLMRFKGDRGETVESVQVFSLGAV